MTTNPPQTHNKISVLFELEQEIRKATTLASLQFLIVNNISKLIHADQAIFFSMPNASAKPHLKAISSVASIDKTTPFVHWINGITAKENKKTNRLEKHIILPEGLSDYDKDSWNTLSPPNIIWIPLLSPIHGPIGILLLSRQTPWENENELVLLDHIGLSYAHALQVFHGNRPFAGTATQLLKKPFALLILLLVSFLMFIPVTLTTLGSAEIVPVSPFVLTSPLQGVIKEIVIESNQKIKSGQTVAFLDDQEVRNNLVLATKALEIAVTQLKRAERAAFVDPKMKEALDELKAQVDLRKAEVQFAQEQMNRTTLISAKDGIAIVSRPEQWTGRPVNIGEKILTIADPTRVEIDVMVSVSDVIQLKPGNTIRIFLDSDPLTPKEAKIVRFEYEPQITELGNLAYRVTAEFTEEDIHPRIGLRGTAKIYGESVTLFYYIFRRPLLALQQWWRW